MRITICILFLLGACYAGSSPYLSLSSKNSLSFGYKIGSLDLNIGIGASFSDDKSPVTPPGTSETQTVDVIPLILIGYYLFSIDKFSLYVNNLFQFDRALNNWRPDSGPWESRNPATTIKNSVLIGGEYLFNKISLSAGIGPTYSHYLNKITYTPDTQQSISITYEIRLKYYFKLQM